MLTLNSQLFERYISLYSSLDEIINPIHWEKIIAKSCNGTWIPGDKYMCDAVVNDFGLNIKTLKKKFTKGNIQTVDFIQCRCPIQNENSLTDEELGKKVIETLVHKREESLRKFNLNSILDFTVIHHIDNGIYNVRVFCENHPFYENYQLYWKNGLAYKYSDKRWTMKRQSGDAGGFQTCVLIKKEFDKKDCILDLKVLRNPLHVLI